jgi:cob(I)alamin adenosyltransferase
MVRNHRVYTRAGDKGRTRLVGGQLVDKDSLRLEAYGTVDELNAVVGLLREANQEGPPEAVARLDAILCRVQNELFNLGSDLATLLEDRYPNQPVIEARHVEALEREMDEFSESLPKLNRFILPGGGWVHAYCHLARTVCRRAERACVRLSREEPIGDHVVPYLNRLSDAFFVFGRWAGAMRGQPESLWQPDHT